ncbi:hypothetical protein ACLB2K_026420 [Fragaria x ananassa]
MTWVRPMTQVTIFYYPGLPIHVNPSTHTDDASIGKDGDRRVNEGALSHEPIENILKPSTGPGQSGPSESLSQLLEPYCKRATHLPPSVASADSSLRKRIRCAPDANVSHRKIFVHDLGWDTTRKVFVSAFEPFGEVGDSNLVMDKLTEKAKGNNFIHFKTRRAALKALREPKKTINNRCTSCQLAYVGPDTNTAAKPSESWSDRKIQGGLGFEKKFGEMRVVERDQERGRRGEAKKTERKKRRTESKKKSVK